MPRCEGCGRYMSDGVTFDYASGELVVDAVRVTVTPQQAVILGLLLKHDRCISYREVTQALWGSLEPLDPESAISAQVHHLRKRIAHTRLKIEARAGYGLLAVMGHAVPQ